MEIGFLPRTALNKLAQFNRQVYPNMNRDFQGYLDFKFVNHPYLTGEGADFKNSIVAKKDDGEIIGQINLLPTRFYFKGQLHSGVWGMDYIVKEQYRDESAGMLLARKAIKQTNHFGVGLSAVSLKIHLAFKEQVVGHLRKFVFINIAQLPISLLLSSAKTYEFPEYIQTKSRKFTRVDAYSFRPGQKYWNNDLIEFTRDSAFMEWRFNENICDYGIYRADDSYSYFVVRCGTWRKLRMLILADYRFSINEPNEIESVLEATKKVVKAGNFDGALTCSSLKTIDNVLGRFGFHHFGHSRDIVTNFPVSSIPVAIDARKFIFLTMADSDTDFNFSKSDDFSFRAIPEKMIDA